MPSGRPKKRENLVHINISLEMSVRDEINTARDGKAWADWLAEDPRITKQTTTKHEHHNETRQSTERKLTKDELMQIYQSKYRKPTDS